MGIPIPMARSTLYPCESDYDEFVQNYINHGLIYRIKTELRPFQFHVSNIFEWCCSDECVGKFSTFCMDGEWDMEAFFELEEDAVMFKMKFM